MAHVTTITDASAYSIAYQIVEAAGAAGAAEQRDVLADLVAQAVPVTAPLYVLLNGSGVAIDNQAAAQTLVEGNCDLFYRVEVAILGGGGGAVCVPLLNPNINGNAVGNFRLDLVALKENNANTATWHIRLSLRHSIIG